MQHNEMHASIDVTPPVSPSRLHGGEPVLEAVPGHPWESRVVLNPAAVLIDDSEELSRLARSLDLTTDQHASLVSEGGACVMLYRAQGDTDRQKGVAPSSLGLALFSPDLRLIARRPLPVISPDAPFHDLGVEDPRCTRVGDTYYLYYTGYARESSGEGRVRICLATSTDLVSWTMLGPADGDVNRYPNKNPALLPEPVDDRWILLHRPMEGPDAMTIHWAEAHDPAGPWQSRGPLMKSRAYREFSRSWIGAGGPPIALTDDRFLMIFHMGHYTHDGRREYDLAAALIDFRRDDPVVARIEPLMRPSGAFEQVGDLDLGVDNVLFTCANFRFGDQLVIPYAGADSRIFGASIGIADLLGALESS